MTYRDKDSHDFERELLQSTRPECPVTYYLLWACAWICWGGSIVYGIWAFQSVTTHFPSGMPPVPGFPWMSLLTGILGMAMVGVLYAGLATIVSLLYRIADQK